MNLIKNHNKVNRIMKDRLMKCFLFIELILYLSFLIIDLFQLGSELSNVIKYSSICLCLTFVFLSYLRVRERSILFMLVILIFTVFSDTFLLFTNQFEIGVLSFVVVQILYSRRIKAVCQDGCRIYMLEVLGVAFLWNLMIVLLKNENLLTPTIVLASLYFLIFTGNIIRIWLQVNQVGKMDERLFVFAMGLTLFYLCDISVGLNFLYKDGVINILTKNAGIFMWFFYLPSQMLLSLNAVLYAKEYDIKI